MSTTSTRLGFLEPATTDAPLIAQNISMLAAELDAAVNGYFSGTASNRATVVPTPLAGFIYLATDTLEITFYNGSAWVDIGPAMTLLLLQVKGDLITASAANTAARVAIGTTAQFLRVVSGLPAWGNLTAADVEALFSAAGQLLVGTGSGSGTLLNPGSGHLKAAGGSLSWDGDSGWTAVAGENGWSSGLIQRLIGNVVYLEGALSGGTEGTIAATLPHPPARALQQNCANPVGGTGSFPSVTGIFTIDTSGNVTPWVNPGYGAFFDGLSYLID